MRMILALAAVAFLGLFAAAPAAAQEAERLDAIAACTFGTVDECRDAIAAYVAALDGLPAAEKDALLADLVVVFATSASPENRAVIQVAILAVADEMTSPRIAAVATDVAADIGAGLPVDGGARFGLASPT